MVQDKIGIDVIKDSTGHYFKNSSEINVLYFRVLEFATHSDARNVIRKLDGTTLNGKKIRLIDVRDLYCHMLNDVFFVSITNEIVKQLTQTLLNSLTHCALGFLVTREIVCCR